MVISNQHHKLIAIVRAQPDDHNQKAKNQKIKRGERKREKVPVNEASEGESVTSVAEKRENRRLNFK